jgi:thiol-disulfide isomerase/thioredoxin
VRLGAHRALGVLLVVVLCGVSGTWGRKPPIVEGGKLAFKLHDLEGNSVTSDDERFKSKVVFVDVFGTWCPPCIRAIPTFKDLQLRYRKKGLVILGIAFEYGDDARERRSYLRGFARQNGVNYLVLDGGTPDQFGTALPGVGNVKGLPIEILIGRDGTVIEARSGNVYKKRWAQDLEARLVEALGIEPTPAQSPSAGGS